MTKKVLFFVVILSLLSLSACSRGDKQKDENSIDETLNKADIPEVNVDISNLDLGKISTDDSFQLDLKSISSYSISDNGDIFAVSDDIPLARYNYHGELKEKYDNAGSLSNIYYYGSKIYAYDSSKNCIVAYDLSSKKLCKISGKFDFEISKIKNLFVADDTVYALVVPLQFFENMDEISSFGQPDENGFIDYNEKLCRTFHIP